MKDATLGITQHIDGSEIPQTSMGVYSHLFELRSWKLPLGGGDRGISETSTV